jgi:hypothetical protein
MKSVSFLSIFSISMLAMTPELAIAAQTDSCPQFENKVRKCRVLQGTAQQRVENQAWRESHVPVLTPEDYGYTLIYIDESIERPVAAQLTGLKLQKVYEHEELLLESNCIRSQGEDNKNSDLESSLWAKVRLPDEFATLCDQGSAYLQVDDHLGLDSQVVSVQPQGILVRHSGRLYWLSTQPANSFPEFRMVWQSSYRIAPALSHSGSKGKTRKKSKKRKKPKRKKAKRKKGR